VVDGDVGGDATAVSILLVIAWGFFASEIRKGASCPPFRGSALDVAVIPVIQASNAANTQSGANRKEQLLHVNP
jgi:hypothetical protein